MGNLTSQSGKMNYIPPLQPSAPQTPEGDSSLHQVLLKPSLLVRTGRIRQYLGLKNVLPLEISTETQGKS